MINAKISFFQYCLYFHFNFNITCFDIEHWCLICHQLSCLIWKANERNFKEIEYPTVLSIFIQPDDFVQIFCTLMNEYKLLLLFFRISTCWERKLAFWIMLNPTLLFLVKKFLLLSRYQKRDCSYCQVEICYNNLKHLKIKRKFTSESTRKCKNHLRLI